MHRLVQVKHINAVDFLIAWFCLWHWRNIVRARFWFWRQSFQFVFKTGSPGRGQFLCNLLWQFPANGLGSIFQCPCNNRRAGCAGDDGDDFFPAIANAGAITPAQCLITPASREGGKNLGQHIAGKGIANSYIHASGKEIVSAKQ